MLQLHTQATAPSLQRSSLIAFLLSAAILVMCSNTAFGLEVTLDCTATQNYPTETPPRYAFLGNLKTALEAGAQGLGGPNTINVVGPCLFASWNFDGYSKLTIRAAPGQATATIAKTNPAPTSCAEGAPSQQPFNFTALLNFSNSSGIRLENLILTGGGTNQGGLFLASSSATLMNTTVQYSARNGITVGDGSTLVLQGLRQGAATPNVIRSNCDEGLRVLGGGSAYINNLADIENNGGSGISSNGTVVVNAGSNPNGRLVNIRGNDQGVEVAPGSATTLDASLPEGTIDIYNNNSWGVITYGSSTLQTNGNVLVQNNMVAPPQGIPAAHRAGMFFTYGGVGLLFPGLRVENNSGAGIEADMHGVVRIGDLEPVGTATGITVQSNTGGGLVLKHTSAAEVFSGNSITGNTGSDASCDVSSSLNGDMSGIGQLQCSKVNK